MGMAVSPFATAEAVAFDHAQVSSPPRHSNNSPTSTVLTGPFGMT